MATTELDLGRYKLGWSDPEQYVFKPRKGLNADIVKEMSWMKGEPDWMRRFRLPRISCPNTGRAGRGSRTLTGLRPTVFETAASTVPPARRESEQLATPGGTPRGVEPDGRCLRILG